MLIVWLATLLLLISSRTYYVEYALGLLRTISSVEVCCKVWLNLLLHHAFELVGLERGTLGIGLRN